MELLEFIKRSSPPIPWAEGDNIPWNEPGFSSRMLKWHLSQESDAASRRFQIIDQQVEWIHITLLSGRPATVLDLGCGPGLYAERLARRGHTVYGIDYSPASIEYATTTAIRDGLTCTYECQDIRQAAFPHPVDLVMLIYGEFNIFRPTDARLIAQKAWQALIPGGIFLLEPHPYQYVQRLGEQSDSWYSSLSGLFSPHPHIVLHEYFWDDKLKVSTIRYHVLDAASELFTLFAQSFQAYQDEEFCSLLTGCGFGDTQILPGLLGATSQQDFITIASRRPASSSH